MPETYRTISFIPFQLSSVGNPKIDSLAMDKNYLIVKQRSQHESILVGETKFSFQTEVSGTKAELDIFDGNVGIITVTREHIINSNISTEEQIHSVLVERREMHRKFIDGSDPLVAAIESGIRKLFASPEIEYNIAKSYVFTLYAFPDEKWVKPDLIKAIFQPSTVGIEDSSNFDVKIEEVEKIATQADAEWLKTNNSDIRNGVIGLISWSSVIVIGGKQSDVNDYVYLEKRVQRAWLNLYKKTEHLSSIIERKSIIGTQEINRIREDASLEVLRVDEILDPALPERQRKILSKMIDTSNFDKLRLKIDSQLKFLEIKMQKQRENTENFSTKLVTSFLFLIALITAYPSLSSLMAIFVGESYSGLLAFIMLAVIFTLFEVIIFRRFEKED
ncbi:MAG: hypothetical protein QXU98_08020 [Candidatus Parvarchaeota archaeon]